MWVGPNFAYFCEILLEIPLSMQSRAVARQALTARRAAQTPGILVQLVSVAHRPEADKECTCPSPPPGECALCRCFASEPTIPSKQQNRE